MKTDSEMVLLKYMLIEFWTTQHFLSKKQKRFHLKQQGLYRESWKKSILISLIATAMTKKSFLFFVSLIGTWCLKLLITSYNTLLNLQHYYECCSLVYFVQLRLTTTATTTAQKNKIKKKSTSSIKISVF
jgi:hypothetical protein